MIWWLMSIDLEGIWKDLDLALQITVAVWSKAWTVFLCSNAGIVDSDPTQGMDVPIVCIYAMFVLFCV
jgi:hypothetical protein